MTLLTIWALCSYLGANGQGGVVTRRPEVQGRVAAPMPGRELRTPEVLVGMVVTVPGITGDNREDALGRDHQTSLYQRQSPADDSHHGAEEARHSLLVVRAVI